MAKLTDSPNLVLGLDIGSEPAFKCAPDSFIIQYFKKIFNDSHKQHLILQIDEHDSNQGYETRIETAVHSYKNDVIIPYLQKRN
jgi:predicted nucleotide-binding protein (sugar kinase/HSP70/actin superfamily)